jgi:xanthine dehydrogenase molybdopterin-binding subunit B
MVIEEIMTRIAHSLGLDPAIVRERNFYFGTGETCTTHYGELVEDFRLPDMWTQLKESAQFEQRKTEIASWNATQATKKRAIAMTPVKFGISFTLTHMNQAGALVLIYQDGTVQVNHGGTEMGQGLHTKMQTVVHRELGVPMSAVRVMKTSTEKVPNTSPTAASAGSDLNGFAVKNAIDAIKARLLPVAVALFAKNGVTAVAEDLRFAENAVLAPTGDRIPFAELVQSAYQQRIQLSSTGFYATPGLHYDRAKGMGRPFHYYSYGIAMSEVEVDSLTGMYDFLRTDILHDCGDSLTPGIDRGQIEGGYVQGVGWLTCEELKWNDQGVLLTHSPDTYKIPAIGDAPRIFNVSLLEKATQSNTIHGSKAVGEPPFMLAFAAREALREAVKAFGPGNTGKPVLLASPATPEAVFQAIAQVRP